MVSEKETELFNEARNRCLERSTKGMELIRDSQRGFTEGIQVSEGAPRFLEILSETNYGFAFVAGVCASIEAKKGKGYKASWQRRGMEGAKANIDRKYDRLTAIMEGEDSEGESLTTNLADLAVYCMKAIALQRELKPEEFNTWLEEARSLIR